MPPLATADISAASSRGVCEISSPKLVSMPIPPFAGGLGEGE